MEATEYRIWELEGVLAREVDKLEWVSIKDTPGFDGLDIPGVYCKFFGKEDKGPWAYLVKHNPGIRIGRHSHGSNVMYYLLQGEWQIGHLRKGPGWFHYEQKGLRYGPIISGERGSLFLVICDARPDYILAER